MDGGVRDLQPISAISFPEEGSRVGCLISLAGPAYYGAYAEYVVVPEWVVSPTPEPVSDEDAASIWMSYFWSRSGIS